MATWIDDFAKHLASRMDYIRVFSLFGRNSEGWLQCELLRFLFERPKEEIPDLQPEKHRHDFWIREQNLDIWCEVKAFSTNYCGMPGKNITNRVDDLLDAMSRVAHRSEPAGGLPLVLALLYPFCDGDQEKSAWHDHWLRLSAGPLPESREFKIPFELERPAYARLTAWTSAAGRRILFLEHEA
jgi:hypothetical protein